MIIELKSVEELHPVHYKQLMTYLKIAHKKVGLLVNFNVDDMAKGIHRLVMERSVRSVSDLEVGAALHAERAEDGGEDSDDEIDDGFPVYFHND